VGLLASPGDTKRFTASIAITPLTLITINQEITPMTLNYEIETLQPITDLVDTSVNHIKHVIKDMTSFILELKVEDEGAYKRVTSVYANARQWKKSIEERRKEIGEPLRKKLAEINAKAKELTDPLDHVIHIANAKATQYQRLLEQQKVDEEAAIKAAAELLGISDEEVFVPAVDSSLRGEGATATTSVKKKFKIVDMNQIPRKYLILDEKAVERDLKLGITHIEGLEVYEEKQTTLRVR
jgi:hypothetical protein